MLEDKIFDEIIEKTDIVGLVSEYVSLKAKGQNFFGLCPFHDEKTPSFSVSPTKKIAMCLGCKTGGNAIKFLSLIEGIPFVEAAKRLADRAGVNFELSEFDKVPEKNKRFYKINSISQQFYTHYLFSTVSGKIALDYLHKRGLTDEIIKMFNIGLSPKSGDTLYKVLKSNEFMDIEVEDAGVIKKGKNGYYDLFSDRIIFPIIDERKNVLAFSGRVYKDTDEPKYINSPETDIFIKGSTLYNMQNALIPMRKHKSVILCEGQMDVIALCNAGIDNVVCSLGTAFTGMQFSLLKRHVTEIIICYDGDDAGINATSRALDIIGDEISVKIASLPNKLDPDEYIKKYGNASFIDFIQKKTLDKYEFIYNNFFRKRDILKTSELEALKNDVFSFLRKVRSNTLVDRFLSKLAVDLAVSLDSLIADFRYKPPLISEKPAQKIVCGFKKTSEEKAFLTLVAYSLAGHYEWVLDSNDNKMIQNLLWGDEGSEYHEMAFAIDNRYRGDRRFDLLREEFERDYKRLYEESKKQIPHSLGSDAVMIRQIGDAVNKLRARYEMFNERKKRGNSK